MTLANTIQKTQYTGVGSVSTYSFPFPAFASTDIVVNVVLVGGAPVLLVNGTDYSVAGAGFSSTGGSITLINPTYAPLPTGALLTIQRRRPLTQQTDIRNTGSSFFPETLENEYDILTMIDQQMQEQLNRAIVFPTTDVPLTNTLPIASVRASNYLAFDASGNVTTVPSTSSISGILQGNIIFGGSNGFPSQNNVLTWDNTNLAQSINGVRISAHGNTATNVFMGQTAGNFTNTGYQSVGIGFNALNALTTGFDDTIVGWTAGQAITTAYNCNAFGGGALQSCTTGQENCAFGWVSQVSVVGGNNNTAFGNGTLHDNVSGNQNVAVGLEALYHNLATGNTGLGFQAGHTVTTGTGITAVGYQALFNATGTDLTACGYGSLVNVSTGIQNTALGSLSGNGLTTGAQNVAVGYKALFTDQTSGGNTAIGWEALILATSQNNTAVGNGALTALVSGANCTGVGFSVLSSCTGNSNTAVGWAAGDTIAAGTANTCIGNGADVASGALTNATSLGNGAIVQASNQICLGNNAVTSVVAGSDGSAGLGLANIRWGAAYATSWNVVHASADSNPSTQVGDGQVVMGAGAGNAPDIRMKRSSANVFTVDNNAGGNAGFVIQNIATFTSGGGLQMGVPTGGDKGVGTINVATNLFLNGTAYTNPDYALEWWAKGGTILKYAKNIGAEGYRRWTLGEIEAYVREHYRLPGIDDRCMDGGIKERFDFLLEKVEELFTHLIEIDRRVAA